MPTTPKSVVVVPGVGARQEEDTVRGLSRAIGRSLRPDVEWPPPMLVTKVADVRCDARDGAEDEAFTVTAYEVAALGPDPARPARRLPVYEFYWASLSRSGEGLLDELRQSWQCLVGLPRIGYQALAAPPRSRVGRATIGWSRAAFGLAWVLMVVRLVLSLPIILAISRLAGEGKLAEAPVRYYDTVFVLDLLTYTALLAFAIPQMALGLADREEARRSRAAGLTLAITLLLTHSLPLTILEFTGLDEKANSLDPWFVFATVPPGSPRQSYGAPWFYYTNSLPGFLPYLVFGLIALWGLATGLAYAWGVRRRAEWAGDAPGAERSMAGVVRASGRFWRAVTFVVLVVTPLVWWGELAYLTIRGKTMLYLYIPTGGDISLVERFLTNPAQAAVKNIWVVYVTHLMLTAVWVILTVPSLRRGLAPLIELVFDMSNYFPPVPVLDDTPALRVLLAGRRRRKPFGSLQRALTVRLREVLQSARARHGGPVCVVTHSLGSIIALSALDDWPPREGEGEGEGPWIDLVTMGCPFDALARLFPQLYGPERSRGGWELPAVRRWLNLYRADDPIGRRVTFPWAGCAHPDRPENEPVGGGGHLGYFDDAEVAARLVRWLVPAAPAEVKEPAV